MYSYTFHKYTVHLKILIRIYYFIPVISKSFVTEILYIKALVLDYASVGHVYHV